MIYFSPRDFFQMMGRCSDDQSATYSCSRAADVRSEGGRGLCHHVTVTEAEVKRLLLRQAYENNKGSAVAFIDESTLPVNSSFGGTPFYLMAAYVVLVEDLDVMRDELVPVLDQRRFWHSTEAHQSDDGRLAILTFANYIGDGAESIIVSICSPIDVEDTNGERARRRCFHKLLSALSDGTFCDQVRLAIFEERKYPAQRSADAMTVKTAIRDEIIDRRMQVLPTSPAHERLLWLPDLVSFAFYQSRTGVREDYLQPFGERVDLIELTP